MRRTTALTKAFLDNLALICKARLRPLALMIVFGMVVASFLLSLRPMAPQLWASFLLSLALVSLLKALTGWGHPEAAISADLYERSTTPVLFSGDMFKGWPSATNGAVDLICAFWGWAVLFFLGINGRLSDILAGALLALGVTCSPFLKESWR